MAGSLAYHAFVSLLPLLLLVMAVVSATGDQQLEDAFLQVISAAVTPGAGDVLVTELQNTSSEVSILGAVVLVWGALRIFRSLDTAFSDIYETPRENTFVDQLVDGLVVLVSFAVVLLITATLESMLSVGVGTSAGWVGQRLLLVLGIGLALAPMYYLFPDESNMAVLEVLPGVGFTAVGLVAFESLFRLYLEYSSAGGGTVGNIIVVVTWLYFCGLVVLVGAAINAVLSNRSSDVSVRPVFGGIPVEDSLEGETEREVGGDTVVDAIDRLEARLPTANEVMIVVDDESVSLSPPEQVRSEASASRLPLVTDTASLELQWAASDVTPAEGSD